MKIEVLFPEISNIYGDYGNIIYLKKCLSEAEFIETNLGEKPRFLEEVVTLVYLGSMTEKMQEKAIKSLIPYKDDIKQKIEEEQSFLFTGNACETLGNYIEKENGTKIEALGIIDFYSKRDMMHRYNSLFLGEFEDIKLVGFKDQFSFQFGNNSNNYFAKAVRGCGMNKDTQLEGFRIKNFFGTTVLGPLLVLNPNFTKYFLQSVLKQENVQIAFEEDALEAYKKRLEEYEDKRRKS